MDDPQDPSSPTEPDKAIAFFREAAARKVERPATPPHYARRVALVIGAVLGLAYGLAAQFCNSLVAPSIPFTHYPFGVVGNIAASVLGFTLVSWIASLPKDFARGALAGALCCVAILELRALFISMPLLATLGTAYAFFSVMGLFIELIVALVVILIYRLMLDMQAEHFDKPLWSRPRIALPLVFLVAAIGLGSFSLYPEEVVAAMRDTNALITRGLSATSTTELPPALRNENGVHDFRSSAGAPYAIELGEYRTFIMRGPLGQGEGYDIGVIARFPRGYAIWCSYPDRLTDPICKSFGPSDAPPRTDFRAAIPPSPRL